MIKDHSHSEKGNPLPPHGLLFPVNSKGSFMCTISTDRITTYHGLCYTSRGALAGTRNSSMGPPHDDPSHHERTLLPRSYISLLITSHVVQIRKKPRLVDFPRYPIGVVIRMEQEFYVTRVTLPHMASICIRLFFIFFFSFFFSQQRSL